MGTKYNCIISYCMVQSVKAFSKACFQTKSSSDHILNVSDTKRADRCNPSLSPCFGQDCCLCAEDIEFLAFSWRPLSGLYELNISRNNLARVPESTLAHLFWETCFSHVGHLTCLSLAYTCLSFDRLLWILRLFAKEIKSSVRRVYITHKY